MRKTLSDEKRAELLAALKEAEAEIHSGKCIAYEPAAFKERLIRIYRKEQAPDCSQ